jgi:hypothetical protein
MKVAAAGDVYMGRFPNVPLNLDEYKTPTGRLDVGKVRAGLRDYGEFIQFSSDDSPRTIAFALEFLRQFCCVCNKAAADPEADARVEVEKPVDRSLERKMEREKFGFCRIDFDEHGGMLRARVGIANPNDVVGSVLTCCRRFAVDCARVLLYLRDELGCVELAGRGDLADLFEEAAWTQERIRAKNAVRRANEKRETCDRRVGGFCSPSVPDCPCFSCGNCVEAVLPSKWEVFR